MTTNLWHVRLTATDAGVARARASRWARARSTPTSGNHDDRSRLWRLLATLVVVVILSAGCTAATPGLSTSPRPEPTLAGSSMSASTGPAVPRASVALIGDRPVLDPRVLGDFGWVLPAAAIVHEGTIHVWVVAFGEVRGDQRPFHLTSADGLTWDVEEGDLASQLGVAYSPPGPVPTSIQVGDGGQWVMYYHGVRPPETDGGEIWRATAEGPSGPWTADAEPLLAAGGAGSWSGRAVDFPSVVQTGNGHVMAFGGHDSRTSIGIATSDDGVTWRPPDEPAISAGLCGGFDDFSVAQPRFVRHGEDGWELVYVGFDTPSARALGLARSVDGLEWTCASPEPLLRSSDIPGSTLVHSFVALTSEDEGADAVRLLVESLRRDGSELWLAELRLRP